METDRIPCGVIEEPDDPVAAPARRVAWVERLLAALLLPALLIYALVDWQGQELRAEAYQAGVAAAALGHWATARTAFARAGTYQDAQGRTAAAAALSAALPDVVFLRRHGSGASWYQLDAEGRATPLRSSSPLRPTPQGLVPWPPHLFWPALVRGAPIGGRSSDGQSVVFRTLINARPHLIWQPRQPGDSVVAVPLPDAAWGPLDFWFAPAGGYLVLRVQEPPPIPLPPVAPGRAEVFVLPMPPVPGSRVTWLARIAAAPSADWPTLALPASGALAIYVTPDRRLQARLFNGTITSTLTTDVDAVWSLRPISACERCNRVVDRVCAAAAVARYGGRVVPGGNRKETRNEAPC
jgi:hypothetical protein